MTIKVKRTKAGNVRVTLSEAQLADLWAILAHSHLHRVHPAKVICAEAEVTSRELCLGFSNAGLKYCLPVAL